MQASAPSVLPDPRPSLWAQLVRPQEDLGEFSTAEWVFYGAILLTPLWWLSGLQSLFFPSIVWGLLLLNFQPEKLLRVSLPMMAWAWLAMALTAAGCAFAGLASIGFPLMKTAATGVTLFKGYGMISAAIILPFWAKLRLKVVTRGVCWLSFMYIVGIVVLFLLLFAGLWTEPFFPPLAKVIPGDKLALRVSPAGFQEFFGIVFPRTSLFTPDPPIPGVIGVLSFFVCLGESQTSLRRLGCAGALVSLVVSQSRLAWITFPAVLLVSLAFRRMSVRQGSLWGSALVNALCGFLGVSVAQLLAQAKAVFTGARADSSKDRALVVGKTLEAWLDQPWFGWGIAMGSVRWHIYDIVLGSFSTYAGVLYLQGVFGMVVFLTALAASLFNFWVGARRGDRVCQRAFATILALCLLVEGLPLSWMCVYYWFFFVWLGAVLAERSPQRPLPRTWEQLLALQYSA
ncbi:MAG: O-antigen ligase family protein [Synechococcales cyanobacterium RM1_1_8]|nr:O-antigen ligase family protein [Synechococcales cyanobacterium RM1_1_8]